jgi:K+-sensing histidine kinase KdpD
VTARDVVCVRLSSKERSILERHGRQLADQLRRDLHLIYVIEEAERKKKEKGASKSSLTIQELRDLLDF